MSKKIIYLLSLLMALSLVFASCKKNGLTPGDIGGKIDIGDNATNTTSNGLYDDFTKIPDDTYITQGNVFKYASDRNYRNPVGLVVGDKSNAVLIISELRYATTTADNDIALDGTISTDIHATVSTVAGKDALFTEYGVIGTGNPQQPTKNPEGSHSAPVVFKVSNTEVVVVASAGVGISRVGKTYDERVGGGQKSELEYSIITLNSEGNITKTTAWEPVKVNDNGVKTVDQVISGIAGWNDPDGKHFAQFGTHSARGYVDATGKMIIPVVVANQGKTGADTEYMGNLILVATKDNIGTGCTLASYTTFDKKADSYSKQKESRIIGVDTTGNYLYIAVPNGQAEHKLTLGKAKKDSKHQNTAPSDSDMSTFSAGDGSVGYLTLKWFGTESYSPDKYGADSVQSGTKKSLLMHVSDTEVNPTIYLLNANTITVDTGSGAKATGWRFVDGIGKASSVDVLGDGTVIIVAEAGGSAKRQFNVVFGRYSQAYLNSKLVN